MFGGTFAGNAAQSLNQTLLEWQRIWLQEEELNRADQREQDRNAFEQIKLDWDKERTRLAEQGADDRALKLREAQVTDNLWESFEKSTSPVAQAAMAESLRGTQYYDAAVGSIQRGFFSNPVEAAAYLEGVLNADIGARFDPEVVRSAAESTGRFGRNLSGQELNDYIAEYVDWANTLDSEATEERARKREELALGNQQAKATLDDTYARTAANSAATAHTVALTDAVRQKMGEDADLHPINMAAATATVDQILANTASVLQGTAFEAEAQPEVMRGLMYANDGKRVSNEILEATSEYVIEQARAQAEKSGYDATTAGAIAAHAFQSAALDVELKQGNIDGIKQQLEMGLKQMDEMDLRNERLGTENEEFKTLQVEARINQFTDLMGAGHVDLAEEYAGRYLKGIVSEDALPNIIQSMRDRAELGLSEEEAKLQANISIAFYQNQNAEELAELELRDARAKVSISETDAEYRARLHQATLDTAASNIRVNEGNLALQQLANTQRLTDGLATPTVADIMKSVKASTGYEISDVGAAMEDYRITSADINEERAVLNNAISNPTSANITAVNELLGTGARNADDVRSLLASREGIWQERLDSASSKPEMIISTIFNWAAPLDFALSPQMFGLDEKDYGVYFNAIQNNPAFRYVPEDVPEGFKSGAADVGSAIDAASYEQNALDITLVGASALFEELKATTPDGLLGALGINKVSDLHNLMIASSQEYNENLGVATKLASARGYDLSNANSRQQAIANINTTIQMGTNLTTSLGGAGELSDADLDALKTATVSWLKQNGRQMTPIEEMMVGPGDLLWEVEQIQNQLRPGAVALNWLAPRMLVQEAKKQQ